nr:hypothetical protein CFP56_07991 [Quercus suber]
MDETDLSENMDDTGLSGAMDSLPRDKPHLLRDSDLDTRYTTTVIDRALTTASKIMLLGCVGQANRIIDLLYEYDQFDPKCDGVLRERFHNAWDASGLWPAAILSPDQDKLRLLWAEVGQPTEDGPALMPYLRAAARREWVTILQKTPAEAAWTWDDFVKARQISDAPDAVRRNAYGLGIEIAFELGLDAVATELTRDHLLLSIEELDSNHFCKPDQVLRSPRLWMMLCDGWLRRELGITISQTTHFVDELLNGLEKRLKNGHSRPYRDHSIEQLYLLLDEVMVKRPLMEGSQDWYDDESTEELPDDPGNEPAAEDEIQKLEDNIKQKHYPEGLPEDYKTFLRLTNGFNYIMNGLYACIMFKPAEQLEMEGVVEVVELLHPESLRTGPNVMFDWPYSTRKYLNLGVVGDSGDNSVISKAMTRRAIGVFRATYDRACRDDRKRIERAVRDIYCSVEQFMELEYAIISSFFVKNVIEGCYTGFRHLLESIVTEAMEMTTSVEKPGSGLEENLADGLDGSGNEQSADSE